MVLIITIPIKFNIIITHLASERRGYPSEHLITFMAMKQLAALVDIIRQI